uniref:MI domain-containing protein n=1 Tax=Hyaloperonospora arabidopsidis (strain Emoy2) TaxID=559515 RepID=M4B9D5_HYAAE
MTEAHVGTRAAPKSAPSTTPQSLSTTGSKLRSTAKPFVFNTKAPAWIPTAVSSSLSSKSQLSLAARPFVPSFTAPTFVPGSKCTSEVETKDTVVSLDADVTSTIPSDGNEEEQVKPATLEPVSTPATSAASSNTSESEIEEHVVEKEHDAEEETLMEAAECEEKQKHDVDAEEEAEAVAKEAEAEKLEVVTAQAEKLEVVTEQALIGERIIYTIEQLLEMEPEVEMCRMPERVKGMVIAAETTTKALSAPVPDESGRGMYSNDSSRSLSRHNSSSSFNEGRGRRERGSVRGGRGGRGGRNVHDTAPALEDCAPLDINDETRWKPTHAKSRLDDPVENVDASLKEAKAILNKLSIEKFDKLSDQLIEVAVRGVNVLKGVIEMVIAKAQMEWHFSTMYAELCAKIAQTAMPAIALEDDEVVADTHKLFRKLLLQRCQKEFEAKPDVEGLKDLREEERLEKELLMKRASLGHIRFVGELFKQRMLSSRIMHECVLILFGDVLAPDEESLECLCNLLSTIGQSLESKASEKAELNHINGYYATIKKMSADPNLLCTRVRFMLQDLLELRSNRWVARRKETKAMTIAEVHAEVAREAKEKERNSGNANGQARLQRSYSMNSTGSTGSNDRRRGSSSGASAAWKNRAMPSSSSSTSTITAPTVDADGWETVTGGARKKGVKHRCNSDRFVAPSSGVPRHPSSARLTDNAFASLSVKESERKERSRSNSSSSTTTRSSRSREDVGRPPTSSPEKLSKSRPAKSEEAPKAEAAPALTAEAFGKKVKAILDEYVELEDMDEAYASFTELNSSNHYGLIPNKVLSIGLDKGDKEREAIASFLAGLYGRKVVTGAALQSALQDLLEFAEDVEIDIPKTLPYLSVMVAPSVVAGSITVPQLVSMSEHLCYNGKAAKLVGSTLAAVLSCEDEAKVQELLATESVDFMALLAETNRNEEAVRAFYKDYSLEFLM